MGMTTAELLVAFGAVEVNQRYRRLVENFTEDATYYDPSFGPHLGKPAITEFMTSMEEVVPGAGARFENWHVEADTSCGFAEWTMVARNAAGVDISVLGESLYRVRHGQVLGVVDYVDPVAYDKLRGARARIPDFVAGMGTIPALRAADGGVAAELRTHVAGLTMAGRWVGTAELMDCAGEDSVGWAQWLFHGPHGDFAGWSLRRPSGHIRDLFDTVTAHQLSLAEEVSS